MPNLNNNTALVSVLMMSYNHEKFITKAIEGVLMQQTSFLVELVIGDDCSNDNSLVICNDFKNKYPNAIKLLSRDFNLGMMANFVSILEACSGKYVAICDGDDYWIDPYKLQKQVNFLEANDDYIACFHNARIVSSNAICHSLFNSLNEVSNPTSFDIISRQWFIASASLLFRNKRIQMPDWVLNVINNDFMLELLLAKEGDFFYMHDVMSVYRSHSNSFSSETNKVKLYQKIIDLYCYVKPLYQEKYMPYFDERIVYFNNELKKEKFILKYPFIVYFDWRYYKRKMFNLLKIRRIDVSEVL